MFTITIDVEKCDGDSSCVDICPNSVLAMKDDIAVIVNADDCQGCMSCVETCPTEAIKVEEQ